MDESSEITGTTVGSVKSALHRGRTKLKLAPDRGDDTPQRVDDHLLELLQRYVALLNARDVDGLRQLVAEDARFEMVGVFEGDGTVITNRYFTNYRTLPGDRKRAVGWLDGDLVVLGLSNESETYQPVSAARVDVRADKITLVRDYLHVQYLMREATEVKIIAQGAPD